MKIYFFHIGYQPYLELTIKKAALLNKVVLIGDESNEHLKNIPNVEHYFLKDNFDGIERFLKCYKHMSTNDINFEQLCFIRWFAVRNVAVKNNEKYVFYGDSDNLIYEDLEKVYYSINKPSIAISAPENIHIFNNSASGEVSYWQIEQLIDFCDYIYQLYEDDFEHRKLVNKWNWHVSNKINGGICDMTALWHFIQDREIFNLSSVINEHHTFDHNINDSCNHFKNEYEMKNGIKEIIFKDGKPFCWNKKFNKLIHFYTLQFQGSAKKIIGDFI